MLPVGLFIYLTIIPWTFFQVQGLWRISDTSPVTVRAEEEGGHRLFVTILVDIAQSGRPLKASDEFGAGIVGRRNDGSATPRYYHYNEIKSYSSVTQYFKANGTKHHVLNMAFNVSNGSPISGYKYNILYGLKYPPATWFGNIVVYTTPINIENVRWDNTNNRILFKKNRRIGYFTSIVLKIEETNKLSSKVWRWTLNFNNYSSSSTSRRSVYLQFTDTGIFDTKVEYYTETANARSSSRYLQFELTNRPELPVNLTAESWHYPQENSVMFTWKQPKARFTHIIFTCLSSTCKNMQYNPIVAPASPSQLVVKGLVSGVRLNFSVRTSYELKGDKETQTISSSTQRLRVSTQVSPPKKISLSYNQPSDSGKTSGGTLAIKIVTKLKEVAHFDNILINVDRLLDNGGSEKHVITLNTSNLVVDQENENGTDRELTYSGIDLNQGKDRSDAAQTIHPIPGGRYKFSASATTYDIILPSPSVNTTSIFVEPRPPMNLTLASHGTVRFILLNWTISSHSIQDKIIIRFCEISEDNRLNCVREDVLTKPQNGEIQHSYFTRDVPSDGFYSIVAIAQSYGKNSTPSNALGYNIGTPCTHPDGLDGRLATAVDNRHRIYYDSNTAYTLICDEGFTLEESGEGQSNTWRCQKGEWEPGHRCIEPGNNLKIGLVIAAALACTIGLIIGSVLVCGPLLKKGAKAAAVEDFADNYAGYAEIGPTSIYADAEGLMDYAQVSKSKPEQKNPTPPLPPLPPQPRRSTDMSARKKSIAPSTEYLMERPKRKKKSTPQP